MLNPQQNKKLLQTLSHCLEVFEPYLFEPQGKLDYRMFETREHLRAVPPDECFHAPVPHWGGPWQTCWFKGRYQPSEQLAGRALYLMPRVGGYEAMLWVDGMPKGTFATKIVVTRHGNHYCDMLCAQADPPRSMDVALEFYAGHPVPGRAPFEPDGPLGGEDAEAFSFQAQDILICTKNQLVADFLFDLRVLLQLAEMLDENSFRRAGVLNTLAQVHRTLYLSPQAVDRETWLESLRAARAVMAPALACRNGDSAPRAALLGHSHMDTAWLWPTAETVRKNARTIANQLSLMEQYPEYRFLQSASCHTAWMQREYPALFERMREAVAQGRYEMNGAVWVECDCNLVGGEALIRQFLWGQRYTRDTFGVLSDCFWLPDTFGYSAAIPQIMRGFGVKYFLTTKLAWNDTNTFPYETFTWRGIDGTDVLAHFFVMDTWPDPKGLLERVNGVGYRDCLHNKQISHQRLIAFGYGDGGGGPQFEMIETARRLADLEGCPRVRYSSASKFMQSLEAEGREFPEYRGELYLELHRGTLTGKQQIKKNNRMAETALHDLELVTVLAAVHSGAPACGAACRPLWETLLVNQFHDILPGSCIPEAHDESLRQTTALLEEAGRRLDATLRPEQMGGVLNPLGFARTDTVYLPVNTAMHAPGLRTQLVELRGGARVLAVAGLRQQPFSFTPLSLCAGADEASSLFHACGNRLETPFALVRFSPGGAISSFVDRRTGRELCAGLPLNTFLSAEDVPAAWDGWDVDADCMEKLRPDGVLQSRMVAADGPVEYRVRCTWTVCGGSVVRQDIIFHADSPLVEFDTELEWHGKHRLLKAAFDTTVQAPAARQEIQFGCIQRPTTRNDSLEQAKFEVCCHKYADLSEPSYGVALLNDCKYGVSVEGGRIALSLAKGGMRPDPRGDEGVYTFRYAFLPHTGGFCAQSVVRPAYAFQYAALPASGEGLPSEPLVRVDAANVMPETVKPCEDGGHAFILRLYECEGSYARTRLSLAPGCSGAQLCDMLEQPFAPCPADLEFRPFEIKTLRITYTDREDTP